MAEASKEYEKGKGGVAPILSDVYELLNDVNCHRKVNSFANES